MSGKDQIHKSKSIVDDMMSPLPEDIPTGTNGNAPQTTPPHDSGNVLKMMLGEETFEKIAEIITDKKDEIKFSNMSLDGKDIEYVKGTFDQHRVLLSDDIPTPIPVIKLGGSTIATVADMTTITGKAKARKSYFLSAVITAALNPTYYTSIEVTLPEGRNKIIWIDTEQSKFWSQQILKRVKRSGVEQKEIDERIIYLNCRNLSISQIKALTYVAIDRHSTTSAFCIIDGSRDLVNSINDEDEARGLSRWLPEVAEMYNINITSVLHQNPSGTEGSKLRGTLGTEFMNKSEFVVEIKVHPKDKTVFIAASMLSRDIGSDEVCFMIKDGLLEFVDEPPKGNTEKGQIMYDKSVKELKGMVRKIFISKAVFNQRNLSVSIQTQLKEETTVHIGIQKISTEWIPYLENKGLIALDENKLGKNGQAKYYKKCHFADTDTVEDEHDFEVIDSTDLPF